MPRFPSWTLIPAALLGASGVSGQAVRHYPIAELGRLVTWTVGDPDLSIGVLDGADPYVFAGLGDIKVLSDRSLAVTNWAPPEIRSFDASGRYLRTIGSQGAGPGEFIQLTHMHRLGPDSLVTWDISQGRGPVFSIRGEYGRQIRFHERPRAWVGRVFQDGSLLVCSRSHAPVEDGASRRSTYTVLLHAGADGTIVDSIGWIPSMELVRVQEIAYWTNPTFAPQGLAAAGPETVWVVDGEAPRLRQLDRRGRILSETTWETPDLRVTEAETDLYWQQYAARGDDFARAAASRRHLPVAEHFPATGRLLVDAIDRIWVQIDTRPSEAAERWLIFGEGGRLLARLDAPLGFSVRDADARHVYGISRDEWDVEQVERRPITTR